MRRLVCSFFVIGVVHIAQYTHVRNENSNTQVSSPNVEKGIPMHVQQETALKGKNLLQERANSSLYLKRDMTVENQCLI